METLCKSGSSKENKSSTFFSTRKFHYLLLTQPRRVDWVPITDSIPDDVHWSAGDALLQNIQQKKLSGEWPGLTSSPTSRPDNSLFFRLNSVVVSACCRPCCVWSSPSPPLSSTWTGRPAAGREGSSLCLQFLVLILTIVNSLANSVKLISAVSQSVSKTCLYCSWNQEDDTRVEPQQCSQQPRLVTSH